MATNKNFVVKNGLEIGGQEVVNSSGVVTSAALGGQTVSSTDSPTFNNLTLTNDIAVGGDINLTGDLNITGDVNSLSVTDLDVTDKTITLGSGQVESASGGSGIIVDGSSASILWDETNTEWDFNNNIKVSGSVGVTNIVTNKVVKFNGSILDDSMITDNGTSVGIDQASPSSTYKLDVSGSIRSATAAPSFALQETDASNQIWLMGSYGGTFAIRDVTGGTYPVYVEQATPSNTLYLDSSGNVGIGTSSPAVLLDIKEGTAATDAIFGLTAGTGGRAQIRSEAQADNTSSELSFHTMGGSSTSERMRIDSSGNALVGTSSLSNQSGSVSANTVVSAHGGLTSHATSAGILEHYNDETLLRSYGANAGSGKLVFKVGGGGGSADSEAMRIDSSGRVIIQDDVAYTANAPTHRGSLILAGASGFTNYGGLEFHTSSGGGAGYGTRVVSSDATMFFGRRFNATGWTESMRIDNTGNLTIGPGTQTGNGDANITIREGNAFAGFDFKSTRTAGNIGGLRYYNTSSDSVPKAQLLVEIDGSYNFYNGSSGAQNRVKIDSSGKVGIGTTNLSNNLSIKGQGANWATSPAIKLWDSQYSQGWYVGTANNQTAGDFYIRTVTSETAYPVPGNEQFTLKQDGSLCLGRLTSDSSASMGGQTPKLSVNGYTSLDGLRIAGGDGGNTIYRNGGTVSVVSASHSVDIKGTTVNLQAGSNQIFRAATNHWSLGGGTYSHGRVRSYHYHGSLSAGQTVALLQNQSAHTDVNFIYWIEAFHSSRSYRTGMGTFGGYGMSTSSASNGGLDIYGTNVSTGIMRLDIAANSTYATSYHISMMIFGDSGITVHNGTMSDQIA